MMCEILIEQGNAVEWTRNYKGEPFHALLCDPPYHLTSIVKRFGNDGAAPAQFGTDGAFARASKGFMGKQWDGGDVAFDPETWAAFGDILYPGAFGMAFASSRGWHRLAVAIEDAGFVIHPSIFGWCYGSGFPKATRVNHGDPHTETFAGHRYGLQALKPALEPIIVFQKPYEGRPVDNITTTGAGVLNIDAGRIGTDLDDPNIREHAVDDTGKSWFSGQREQPHGISSGRWPANFYLDSAAAELLDAQVGPLTSNSGNMTKANGKQGYMKGWRPIETHGISDSGGASRFFFRVNEQLDEADPVRYCAKASRTERDAGLDGMPLIELKTHGEMGIDDSGESHNTTGQKPALAHNPHPTVKPLSLARYLATLLLPPGEYAPRRLFVPFAGVASECIGAMQAGWDAVTGVELTEEYVPLARARVEYWRKQGVQMKMELG